MKFIKHYAMIARRQDLARGASGFGDLPQDGTPFHHAAGMRSRPLFPSGGVHTG